MATTDERKSPSFGDSTTVTHNQPLVNPDIFENKTKQKEYKIIEKLTRYCAQPDKPQIKPSDMSGFECEAIGEKEEKSPIKVFRARDPSTGEIHVVKAIKVESFKSCAEHEVMCQHEIRETGYSPKLLWIALNHQNVELHMDYIDGQTVGTILKRTDIDQDILKILALHMLDSVIEGLLSFAGKGWNHGDIWENNLMVVENVSSTSGSGISIKIIDFGYAKPFEEKDLIKDFKNLVTGPFIIVCNKLNDGEKKDMDHFLSDETLTKINNKQTLSEYHLEVKEKKKEVCWEYCLKMLNKHIFHPVVQEQSINFNSNDCSRSSSGISPVNGNQMLEGLRELTPQPTDSSGQIEQDLESFGDLQLTNQIHDQRQQVEQTNIYPESIDIHDLRQQVEQMNIFSESAEDIHDLRKSEGQQNICSDSVDNAELAAKLKAKEDDVIKAQQSNTELAANLKAREIEVKKARKSEEEMNKNISKMDTDIQQLKQRVAELEETLKEKKKLLTQSENEKTDLKKKKNDLKKKLHTDEEDVKKLKKKVEDLEKNIKKMQDKNDELEENIKVNEAFIDEKKKLNEKLNTNLQAKDDELVKLTQENEKLNTSLQAKDDELVKPTKENVKLKTSLQAKDDELVKLTKDNDKLKTNIYAKDGELVKTTRDNDELEKNIKTREASIEEKNNLNEKLKNSLQVKDDEFVKLTKENDALEKATKAREASIEENKILNEELEKTIKAREASIEGTNKLSDKLRANLQAKDDELVKRTKVNDELKNSLQAKIDELEKTIKQNTELDVKLKARGSEVKKAGKLEEELKNKIYKMEYDILQLKNTEEELRKKIPQKESDFLQCKQKVAELEETVKEKKQLLTQSENEKTDLKKKKNDLKKKLHTNEEDVKKLKKKVEDLEKNIKKMQDKDKDLEKNFKKMQEEKDKVELAISNEETYIRFEEEREKKFYEKRKKSRAHICSVSSDHNDVELYTYYSHWRIHEEWQWMYRLDDDKKTLLNEEGQCLRLKDAHERLTEVEEALLKNKKPEDVERDCKDSLRSGEFKLEKILPGIQIAASWLDENGDEWLYACAVRNPSRKRNIRVLYAVTVPPSV